MNFAEIKTNSKEMKIEGRIVDVMQQKIFEGCVEFKKGIITKITPQKTNSKNYILPGFVDSHIHIESSMLTPVAFGAVAVKHGTVAIVTDPHEIANVCGIKGIEFMVNESKETPLKIYFTVPSCVPSTPFENSGEIIDSDALGTLIEKNEFVGVSEMMNYPGVIAGDNDCISKIAHAKRCKKPVDGHYPLLCDDDLQRYIDAGISTDHETDTKENALDKLHRGMKIMIRNGSSARNFEDLIPIIKQYPEMIMFCSDDLKASELRDAHINKMVAQAVSMGHDLFDVLKAASYNPIKHYNLNVGMLNVGDSADFIVCENISDFIPLQTWISGVRVDNITLCHQSEVINNFKATPLSENSIYDTLETGRKIDVIGVIPDQIVTEHIVVTIGKDNDFQKIIVLNRYVASATPGIGYIRGFNFLNSAVASTVSHDSHNIIATGSSDKLIIEAVNKVIEMQGGIVICTEDKDSGEITTASISLAVAGLMSNKNLDELVAEYKAVTHSIKLSGCTLTSPLMTLSFMALPVIPKLKITDKGLFDSVKFEHVAR